MSRNGHLRASDADREMVAERLRNAATEGRIATDELDERLGATLTARTYGELEAVVSDLPRSQPARLRPASPALSIARVALALAIVVPLMMALIFVVTGILAGWMLWAAAGWWFFGRHNHRRRHYHRYGGPRQIHPHAGAGSGRGYRL